MAADSTLIDYHADRRLLAFGKGHPFDRPAFFGLLDRLDGWAWTYAEQPAAAHLLNPNAAGEYAALLFYDMPGIDFLSPGGPHFLAPPMAMVEGFEALLQSGRCGLVFLHHAVAAWPSWPRWADVIGARFFYAPARHAGADYPDSGYRHDVTHRVTPADPEHPVAAGLKAGFDLTDELYLFTVFNDGKTPLMISDHRFRDTSFFSAAQAVQGRMYSRAGWRHPPGTNLIAWAKHVGNTPLVYIQSGDGASAYDNPGFQRLLSNALNWVAAQRATP